MATSRTGTARWKTLRAQVLKRDQAAGLTHCPLCRTPLDWTRSRTPASPEVDHIIPFALGGTDTIENTRTICRHCNQRLGRIARQQKHAERKQQRKHNAFTGTLNTSQNW